MKRLSKRFKRALRRSQTGQAILLLAFGFLVLLGFVGIVTDLSLLFVRFTALRRAVDSAAVAAAGQFNRTESDQINKERTTFAARQFLEFHGIDPSGVIVDTCSSVPNNVTPASPDNWNYTDADIAAVEGGGPRPVGVPLDIDNEDAATLMRYQREVFNDVCDPESEGDPTAALSGRKLVRVQASISVPTTFMSLFGYTEFDLTASAVSETASLDVVIVLDVSESMLFDTTYDDYDAYIFGAGNFYGPGTDRGHRFYRYLPPRIAFVHDHYENLGGLENSTTEFRKLFLQEYNLGGFLVRDTTFSPSPEFDGPEPWRTVPDLDPATQVDLSYGRYYMDGNTPSLVDPGNAAVTAAVGGGGAPGGVTLVDMREDCRVAVHPASVRIPIESGVPNEGYGTTESLLEQYNALTGDAWSSGAGDFFQANFDFYGCCNDPTGGAIIDPETRVITPAGFPGGPDQAQQELFYEGRGDNDFSDLVCQPFKQARDASMEFLLNIDFVAGDRVAFVTFDRTAHIIDPDLDGTQYIPMISDRAIAMEVLTQSIGVRAEPTFYTSVDPATTGLPIGPQFDTASGSNVFYWNAFSNGTNEIDTDGDGENDALEGIPLDRDAQYEDLPSGALTREYLVRDSCAFDNAALPGDNGFGFSIWDPNNQEWGILGDAMTPDLDSTTRNKLDNFTDPIRYAFQSYEFWGQCRGTNIGAALRESNNVLTNPGWTRRDGAVWVVVLLSDGAAGATDPIGGGNEARPYLRADNSQDWRIDDAAPIAADYGVYGFCPNQAQNDSGELVDSGVLLDAVPPHCTDLDPETRHACGTDIDGDPNNKLPLEIPLITSIQDTAPNLSDPGCASYDPDDYARDWADFVAMDRGDNRQLPTIYTIGFNLEYNANPGDPGTPDGAANKCEANPTDCLGEELLRYIADIGDNNERNVGDYPNAADGDRFTEVNYGNYWNAPDGDQLTDVFDEIASRLFIRLTG